MIFVPDTAEGSQTTKASHNDSQPAQTSRRDARMVKKEGNETGADRGGPPLHT